MALWDQICFVYYCLNEYFAFFTWCVLRRRNPTNSHFLLICITQEWGVFYRFKQLFWVIRHFLLSKLHNLTAILQAQSQERNEKLVFCFLLWYKMHFLASVLLHPPCPWHLYRTALLICIVGFFVIYANFLYQSPILYKLERAVKKWGKLILELRLIKTNSR